MWRSSPGSACASPASSRARTPAIPATLRAVLERSFLTGVAFVQTDFYDPMRHPPPEYPFPVPNAVLHAVPSSQANLQKALDALLETAPQLLARSTELVEAVQQNLRASDIPALTREARKTLGGFDEMLRQIQWEEIDAATRALLSDMRAAVASARSTIDQLQAEKGLLARAGGALACVEKQVAGADVPATTAALRRLLDEYGDVAPRIADLLPSLQRAADAFRRLADLLERDPGALLRGRTAPDDPRSGR